MYKAFYGLKDNPFSIAPNPQYLFLSDRHREALAHLSYGLGDTGGFVLLTGEVGTGKTTVSRTLLQQLPDNTDTAFILNPALTELELLATLCDELNIDYGEQPSLKTLTDRISEFLLANHQQGRNTLLIIDEAQHLKAAVLEQLRLLTNLETDTKKLLQVILIGQPELQQLLKRQELRQLAQRITARYHLLPLDEAEVVSYVRHRLEVAERFEPLFTARACKALHKHSGGIPRLINLLCERALMAGYGQSKVPIDHQMVNMAAAEILGEEAKVESQYRWPMIALLCLGVTFAGGYYFFNSTGTKVGSLPAQTQANNKQQVLKPITQVKKATNSNDAVLKHAISTSRDINTSFAVLFGLWGKTPYKGITACQAAQVQGLSCHQQQGDWQVLTSLNYPAVLYLFDSNDEPFYAAVVKRDGERLLLQLAEQQIWIDKQWFKKYYSGTFELLWQNSDVFDGEINRYASMDKVQWLEDQLAMNQNRAPRVMSHFDVELKHNLMSFQRRHGLKADGIVGQQTFIQLSLFSSQVGPRLIGGDAK
ncbi:MAG: ExeA family protein [Parashewanella sp.]